ncbi:MAG: hypothetical protein R3Y56_09175 [Akkermansia sp.]
MKTNDIVTFCSAILAGLALFGVLFWLDSCGYSTLGGAIFVTGCAIPTWMLTIRGYRKGKLRLGAALGTTFERDKQPVRFFLTLLFSLTGNLLFTAFACYLWSLVIAEMSMILQF